MASKKASKTTKKVVKKAAKKAPAKKKVVKKAAKKPAKEKAPSVVEGVTVSKLDRDAFEAAYENALELNKDASKVLVQLPAKRAPVHERVKMLVLWYRAVTPNTELGGCSECGGDSDMRLGCCPYCGDEAVVDEEGNVVEQEAEDEEGEELESEEGDGEDGADDGGEELEEADEEEVEAEPEVQDRKPAAPSKRKRKRKLTRKGDQRAKATHDELDQAASDAAARDEDPPGNTGVTVLDPKGAEQVLGHEEGEPAKGLSVRDLDRSVTRLEKLKAGAAHNLWKMGQEIRTIAEKRLWMLRKDDAGKRAYRTFKQFCVGDLGLSYMHAHRLVQVSAAFTEEEVKAVGVSKCHLLLKVPEDKRKQLLDGAGDGSRAQLSDAVNDLTNGERPKPPKGALTVAMAPGRVELKLSARPKGREGYPSASEQKKNVRAAKSISDDPFAYEVLPNDVVVLYHLAKDKDGSLLLVVQRRRAKDEQLFDSEDEEEGEDE